MTIDERLEALVMTSELHLREIEAQRERLDTIGAYIQADAENIRRLAHIAEIHERRLDALEDGRQQ